MIEVLTGFMLILGVAIYMEIGHLCDWLETLHSQNDEVLGRMNVAISKLNVIANGDFDLEIIDLSHKGDRDAKDK